MNKLIKGLAREGRVSLVVCQTDEIVDTAAKQHLLMPNATVALGRTMTFALMLASHMKQREHASIIIQCEGEIGGISVDASFDGKVRGHVNNPNVAVAINDAHKLDIAKTVGPGYLSVSKYVDHKMVFTGQVTLISAELGEDFAYYLQMSEQIASVVSVGVLLDTDGLVKNHGAGGFLIQLMPDATEEDILFIEKRMESMPSISSMLSSGLSCEQVANKLFDDFNLLATKDILFECSCSKEELLARITALPQDEIAQMKLEEDQIEVVCHHCNTHYYFDTSEF